MSTPFSKKAREQKIDAYRDGALSSRGSRAFERRLGSDAEAQTHLRRSEALGRAVREVWSEGPPAPRVDLVVQSLRPHLARIDAEVADSGGSARWFERLLDRLGPVPLAVAGAAAALALAMTGPDLLQGSTAGPGSVSAAGFASFSSPSAIYDLSQDGAPLLIFEGEDGATVIWILENPDSRSLASMSLSEF